MRQKEEKGTEREDVFFIFREECLYRDNWEEGGRVYTCKEREEETCIVREEGSCVCIEKEERGQKTSLYRKRREKVICVRN